MTEDILMYAVSIIEQAGIPVEIKNIEKLADTVVIDPEYSVVEL